MMMIGARGAVWLVDQSPCAVVSALLCRAAVVASGLHVAPLRDGGGWRHWEGDAFQSCRSNEPAHGRSCLSTLNLISGRYLV